MERGIEGSVEVLLRRERVVGAWHLEMEREIEFSVRYLSHGEKLRDLDLCLSLSWVGCGNKSRIEHFFLASETEQ